MKPRALIPTGLGFNCEQESKRAFELAGGEAEIFDIRDMISGKVSILDYNILMIIGGFSFGDDLGSGKAISDLLRFKKIRGERFIDIIRKFVLERNGTVLGVCNGFQVLVKLGILPGFDRNFEEQNVTLALNSSGRYEDRWVRLMFNPESPCIATKGIESMDIPVRHGEGRLIAKDNSVIERIMANNHYIAQYADDNNEPASAYPKNPNGSVNAIAGLCDETGRIFGIMPHPEAFLMFENHPQWTRLRRECMEKGILPPVYGDGLRIFRNIVNYYQVSRAPKGMEIKV